MRPPRSFSLLTLLLTTAILALSITIYVDRISLTKAHLQNKRLADSVGEFQIEDRCQIYVRSLRKQHKMCWEFRIYVPPGESCTFHYGDGILNDEMPHPAALTSREIEGSDEQTVVSLQIRRVGSGTEWGVNNIGVGQLVCTDPKRFHWLSQVEEMQELRREFGNQHGDVQIVESGIEKVVWMQSEKEYHAFDPDAGKQPRVFMAWITPNKTSEAR